MRNVINRVESNIVFHREYTMKNINYFLGLLSGKIDVIY